MALNRFRNGISSRIIQLDDLIAKKNESISDAPEGHIRVMKYKRKTRFYQVTDANKNGRYISEERSDLVGELMQKNYDIKVRDSAMEELEVLKAILKKNPSATAEEVYELLSEDRRKYIKPILLPDDEFVANWLSEVYTPKPFREGDPYVMSNKGDKVRSKSEKIIADRLLQRNIPYKYERPHYLEGFGWGHPDFTVLNVRQRRVKYLEHNGRMDNPEYAFDFVERTNSYGKNGIIVGDSLIHTFETDGIPLDVELLDKIIDKHFL